MLVLNRKVGEKICIDGQIVVTVSRIQGSRVSLAIQAPRDIHVMRGELRPFIGELQPGSIEPTKMPEAPTAPSPKPGRAPAQKRPAIKRSSR